MTLGYMVFREYIYVQQALRLFVESSFPFFAITVGFSVKCMAPPLRGLASIAATTPYHASKLEREASARGYQGRGGRDTAACSPSQPRAGGWRTDAGLGGRHTVVAIEGYTGDTVSGA